MIILLMQFLKSLEKSHKQFEQVEHRYWISDILFLVLLKPVDKAPSKNDLSLFFPAQRDRLLTSSKRILSKKNFFFVF